MSSIYLLFFFVAVVPIQGRRPSWRCNLVFCHSSCCEQSERLVFGPSPTWQCLRLMTGPRQEWHTQELVLQALFVLLSSHLWYLAEISPKKSQSLWCFGCHGVNLCVPDEVVADVHSVVLSTVHYFQCVSMELVFRLPLLLLFIRITWHFSGRNCICPNFSQFSKAAKSSCSPMASMSD